MHCVPEEPSKPLYSLRFCISQPASPSMGFKSGSLYHNSEIDTCCSWNNPRDDDHIVPHVLEVQMPKLWLGSIISRLQCWSRLHWHTNNSGCLGLTWHPWTDCTSLVECRISWSAPHRVIFIGFLDTAILGFYERKRWCVTGAKKRCCV